MRKVFSVVALLMFCALASGNNYTNGYVNSHGYAWNTQYSAWQWPATGQYYKLTYQTVQQPYVNCGTTYYRSYQQPYYSQYYPPQIQQVSYKDPNYLDRLAEIALQRDRFVLQTYKERAQVLNFKEAVDALGLTGNFRVEGYGAPLPGYGPSAYGQSQNYQVGNFGSNGNTVYGYSMQQVLDLYGDNSVALGIQQLGRATQGAQQLAGDVASSMATVIDRQGDRQAKFAEILARGQAIALAAKAFDPNSVKIETKEQYFKVVPGPDGKMQAHKIDYPPTVAGKTELLSKEAFYAMAHKDCGKCHADGKKNGNFELSMMFNAEWKKRVENYITSTDKDRGCPKDETGKYVPLPPDRLNQYLLQLSSVQ